MSVGSGTEQAAISSLLHYLLDLGQEIVQVVGRLGVADRFDCDPDIAKVFHHLCVLDLELAAGFINLILGRH